MKTNKIVPVLISSLIAGTIAQAQVHMAIQHTVSRYFKSSHVASMTVLVSRDGKYLYSGSFGLADIEQKVAASPHTVYAIGSISKSFTAFCVLKLAENGKLNLDAQVGSILKEIKGAPAKVTIRQLLVHIGGIPDYEPTVAKDEARTYTETEVLSVFNNKPLDFRPGAFFSYSNSDHYLLGLIIEKVTGMRYAQVLKQYIFKPFGLSHTAYGEREEIIPWRARGYDVDDSLRLVNAAPWHESVPFAAGGIVSTSADVDKFTRAIVAGAGHGPLAHAFDHVKLSNGTALSYLPISLADGRFHGLQYYWHAGEIDGFMSFSAIVPSKHLTFTMLINTIDPQFSPYALFHKIARIVLNLPPANIKIELNQQLATKFAGHYNLYVVSAVDGGHLMNKSFPAEFAYQSGRMYLKAGIISEADTQLNYIGSNRFVSSTDPDQVYIFTNMKGKIHLVIDDTTPWVGDKI